MAGRVQTLLGAFWDKVTHDHIFSAFAAALCAIPLLILAYHNEDSKKVERYLYENDQERYHFLQVCVFILTVALLFNTRYLMAEVFNIVTTQLAASKTMKEVLGLKGLFKFKN